MRHLEAVQRTNDTCDLPVVVVSKAWRALSLSGVEEKTVFASCTPTRECLSIGVNAQELAAVDLSEVERPGVCTLNSVYAYDAQRRESWSRLL